MFLNAIILGFNTSVIACIIGEYSQIKTVKNKYVNNNSNNTTILFRYPYLCKYIWNPEIPPKYTRETLQLHL